MCNQLPWERKSSPSLDIFKDSTIFGEMVDRRSEWTISERLLSTLGDHHDTH